SLDTGAVTSASACPVSTSRRARRRASIAAIPPRREGRPIGTRPGSPTTIGRQARVTRGSRRAFETISGPIPAGSPKVIAMRGFSLIETVDFDVGFGAQVLDVGLKSLGGALVEEVIAQIVLDLIEVHFGG